jgi:hypothetical protein
MLQPEAQWHVVRNGEEIVVTPPKKQPEHIKVADLTRIVVVTNDTGPWGMDVWWMLIDDETRRAVSYPQGATGEQAMLDWMLALPGFEHSAMIEAMGSTGNAEFVCWRR